ncbi:hypothetical protein Vafri_12055, partial [Volvox africanus]
MTHKTFYFSRLIGIALTVGWVVNASAWENEYEFTVNRVQTGAIPDFPFRNCDTNNGAYLLAPAWRPMGGTKYCFNIEVMNDPNTCWSSCCTATLHKIEFNVSDSCLVPGAYVTATLNGVPTRVGATFDKPPYGNPGSGILRITQLGLDTETAQGAELCITLKPNRARQGCTTLEQLCSSPGFPAGTCTAAMFDAGCDCCPISQAAQARPPPPPPPSPPPPPPPPP